MTSKYARYFKPADAAGFSGAGILVIWRRWGCRWGWFPWRAPGGRAKKCRKVG